PSPTPSASTTRQPTSRGSWRSESRRWCKTIQPWTRWWSVQLGAGAGRCGRPREPSACGGDGGGSLVSLAPRPLTSASAGRGLFKGADSPLLPPARPRIGFDRQHARDPLSALLSTHRVSPPATAAHIVEQNLSLLGPLGISHPEVAFPLPVVQESEAWAEQCL